MIKLKPTSILIVLLAVVSLTSFLITIGDSYHLYQNDTEEWISVIATDATSDIIPAFILSLLIISGTWLGFSSLLSGSRQISLFYSANLIAPSFIPIFIGLTALLRFVPGIANIHSGLFIFSTTLAAPIFIVATMLCLWNFLRHWQNGTSSFDTPLLSTLADRQIGWLIFVITSIIFAITIPLLNEARPFDGDQPHYLIVTHSLIEDGDIYIGDDHDDNAYKAFTEYDIEPQYYTRTQDGEIIPVHKFGISILAIIPYLLGGRLGALLMIGLMAALAAANTYWLTIKICNNRNAALIATIAVVFSVPALPMSHMFFTEIPSALFLLVIMNLLVSPSDTAPPKYAWLIPFIIWSMPWLHIRNYMVAFLLTGFLIWRMRKFKTEAISLLLLSLVLAMGIPVFNFLLYGSFSPVAEMGASQNSDLNLLNLINGVGGLLFDQEFGALLYSPVLWLAMLGVVPFWKQNRNSFLQIFIIFGVSLGTSLLYTMWWGGSSPPARYLASVIHLCSIPLALLIAYWKRWRIAIMIMILLSVIIGATIIADNALLINGRDGSSLLLTSRSMANVDAVEWWPSWIAGGERAWPLAATLIAFLVIFFLFLNLLRKSPLLQSALALPMFLALFLPYTSIAEQLVPDEPNGFQPTSHEADALLHNRYRNSSQLINLNPSAKKLPLPPRRFSGHLLFGQDNLDADSLAPRGRSRKIGVEGEVITLSPDEPFAAGKYQLLLCLRAESASSKISVTYRNIADPAAMLPIFQDSLDEYFTVFENIIELPNNSSALQFRISPSHPIRFLYFILQPIHLQTRQEYDGADSAFNLATWNFNDFLLSGDSQSIYPPEGSEFWTHADIRDKWIIQSKRPFADVKMQLSSRTGISFRAKDYRTVSNIAFTERQQSQTISFSPKVLRTESGIYYAEIEIASSGHFVPAELDSASKDKRKLGVRVKIILE